ncbi:MAG: glycoside hydrolase family 88 protein [Clostridia bacterium]|nr:glycoside hydrolase family 88 protein [Clostridia bacterium]
MKKILDENKPWIDETWEKITVKLRRNSKILKNKIPSVTTDGVYDDKSKNGISWWTNGFWPGIMWLMYDATGEEGFKETAENVENALDRALENFKKLDHDVGFIWHISAGANYLLTGNETSKNRNLHAAATLASRYNVDAGFIRAWNWESNEGWAIIDCMMNLPLLYWASKETGNVAFKKIADHHLDKTINHHIRSDGSTYHVVEYDVNTGEVLSYPWTQGYDKDHSSWARGQSWAIYGFVLAYLHTKNIEYLDMAKKCAHYFIANVCSTGYVPRHDFRQPDEPCIIDTSAGAVAACGLIEIAKAVPEFENKMYMDAAVKIIKALTDNHCNWTEEEQSILQNSSACYNSNIHRSHIYGEYFYVESMYKLKGFDKLFW